MNIGGRIQQRLEQLKWQRKDLLERVEGLSDQNLSNLIRRDSTRSEWDTRIASALGVTVLWLVYGIDDDHGYVQQNREAYDAALSEEEETLINAWRIADGPGQSALLYTALGILGSSGLGRRTGTK